jgi:hypothetical protein
MEGTDIDHQRFPPFDSFIVPPSSCGTPVSTELVVNPLFWNREPAELAYKSYLDCVNLLKYRVKPAELEFKSYLDCVNLLSRFGPARLHMKLNV